MSQNTVYITDNEIYINQDTTPSSFKRTQINTIDKSIPVFKCNIANITNLNPIIYKNNNTTINNYFPLKMDKFSHTILDLKDYISKSKYMMNTTNSYFPLNNHNYIFSVRELNPNNYKFSSLNINAVTYVLLDKKYNINIEELQNKKYINNNITHYNILLKQNMLISNNYKYIIRQDRRLNNTIYPFIPKKGLYYYSTNEELIIQLKDHTYNFSKFIVNVDTKLNKINNYIFNQKIVLSNVPKRFSITFIPLYRIMSNIINNNENTDRKYRSNIANLFSGQKIFNTILSNNNKLDNNKIINLLSNNDDLKRNIYKTSLINKEDISLTYLNGYTNTLFINGLHYDNNIISQVNLTDFILKNFKYTIDDNIYKKSLEYDEYFYNILYTKFGFNTMYNFAKQNKDIKIINEYLTHNKNTSLNEIQITNKINRDDFSYNINKKDFNKPGVYFTDAFVGCKKGKIGNQFVDLPFKQAGGTDITNPLGLIRYSTLVNPGIYFDTSFTLRVILTPTGGGVENYNFGDLNGIVIPKGFELILYKYRNNFDGSYSGDFIEFKADEYPIFINDFESNVNYNELKVLYQAYKYDNKIHVEYINLQNYINGSMEIKRIDEHFKLSQF